MKKMVLFQEIEDNPFSTMTNGKSYFLKGEVESFSRYKTGFRLKTRLTSSHKVSIDLFMGTKALLKDPAVFKQEKIQTTLTSNGEKVNTPTYSLSFEGVFVCNRSFFDKKEFLSFSVSDQKNIRFSAPDIKSAMEVEENQDKKKGNRLASGKARDLPIPT